MKLCMIGTGYVGLVSGVCFSDLGNTVYCVDNDIEKINALNKGILPIYEPGLDEILKRNYKQKRLIFTNNLKEAVENSDIIFICVGTPTKKNSNSADLKYVFNVANNLKKFIKKYKVVVTKSTVPVTTGDKIEKILIKQKRKKLVDVVSNPEFLREGEAIRDFLSPDRVVVGTDSYKANKFLKSLYLPIIKKTSRYFRTSRRGAELIKYASNAFLATKISYINELANLCEKTNIDIKEISQGMGSDQRIGDRFLRAGPAYGGSCFPKDTRAIIDTSNKFKSNLSIIKAVIKSNEDRKNMGEASSLYMIPKLLKKGAIINYFDPSGKKNEFKKFKRVNYCKNVSQACLRSDLILLHTEWNEFKTLNFKKLIKKSNFKVFDMRNLYSPTSMKKKGINYFGVGR